MRRISVAELRQNPTKALNDAADGIPSEITKHGRVVARLMPPEHVGVPFERVRHLFRDPDPIWAAEIEAERDRDRLDPSA